MIDEHHKNKEKVLDYVHLAYAAAVISDQETVDKFVEKIKEKINNLKVI